MTGKSSSLFEFFADTTPFSLPGQAMEKVSELGGKKKVTIIICPLKALEADQVKQATEKGLSATLINEDNVNDPTVWKKVEKSAQLVYMSPEMALSDRFGKLWMAPKFRGRVNALIVDEAHCIDEWGEDFRFTGQEVPSVACTATCATSTFYIIWNSLGFGYRPVWGLDAGSDRANLFFQTRTPTNIHEPILDILNLLPTDLDDKSPSSAIPKILSYHGSVAGTGKGKSAWRLYPRTYATVLCRTRPKYRRLQNRTFGRAFYLAAIEFFARRMQRGWDATYPTLITQSSFECPRSLAVLVKRWGHAGRSRKGIGTCLFSSKSGHSGLPPPDVGLAVQRVKGKEKLVIEPQTHTTSRGKLEPNLEAFINSATSTEGKCFPRITVSRDIDPSPQSLLPRLCLVTVLSGQPVSTSTPAWRLPSRPNLGLSPQSSAHELSWTVLDLKRHPPPERCCNHCNPGYLSWCLPTTSRDPRILKYASEFIHSLRPPPSRPVSPSSDISDSVSVASQNSIDFEPVKGKQNVSKEDKAALQELLLEKLVASAGTFLKHPLIEPKHIQKAGPWDMAPDSDVAEACHRAAVLQQSPPASSESSLSTVMRADGTPQAKLEEHCGTFITECVDAASGIALWTVLWCKRVEQVCYHLHVSILNWCKFDIENKYRPPDDEKVLSPVGRRLLTENIFTLVPYGTSFIKNKTVPTLLQTEALAKLNLVS
ncbi:hypothetical protein B0H14DRAFT_3900365 [Mycena olivaceomarginata]|nr:hypothetical protein B0H14DRAFT_3900365 [Mycena olivaceomarginata]